MRNVLAVILILGLIQKGLAQEKTSKISRFYIKPAFGFNLPLSTMKSGLITDHLIEYESQSHYWQFLAASFFITKNWGIEFNYQPASSGKLNSRYDKFAEQIERKYGQDYYIDISSAADDNSTDLLEGDFLNFNFGIVYRMEQSKIIFIPKVLLNFCSIQTDDARIDLKEKGAHNNFYLSYNTWETQEIFSIVPAFTLGYRLSRRFIANIDVAYINYKAQFKYTEKLENKITHEALTQYYNYNKRIQTIAVGFGVIFEILPAGERKKEKLNYKRTGTS